MIVLGSLRVIPCCLGMGQAAGVGSALCVENNLNPAQAEVNVIREILHKQNVILSMN